MKAKMPEPVAEVCSGYQLFWAGFGGIAALCEHNNVKVGSLLITTDQAEAYAAAKVREALRQAIAICQAEGDEWDSDSVEIEKNYAHAARDRIRALIPPLPGPVDPTT